MKLKNNFDENDRQLYADNYECWICGRNTCDSLHHIFGRGGPGSTVESSILNSAPVCNFTCHLPRHGWLMTKPQQVKLLYKTFLYLDKIGYDITTNDKNFIKKYKEYYPSSIWSNTIKEEREDNDM